MIKINLLPSYILERVRIRRAIWWVVAALVVEAAVMGFYALKIRSDLAAEKERLAYWTQEAAKVSAVTSLASDIKTRTAPYQTWVNWFTGLERHNQALGDYVALVSTYVYNRVQLSDWKVDNSAKTVTLTGRTDSLESLARYYLNVLRGPFTNVVLTTTISGWNLAGAPPLAPKPGPGGLPYAEYMTVPVTLTCTMNTAIIAPGAPAAAAEVVGTGGPAPGAPAPGAPAAAGPSAAPGTAQSEYERMMRE